MLNHTEEETPLTHDQLIARIQRFHDWLCIMRKDIEDTTIVISKDDDFEARLQNDMLGIISDCYEEHISLFKQVIISEDLC